jgi:hypothetical protein
MPDPLTFLSQTGEPEVVTVQQKLVELVELTPQLTSYSSRRSNHRIAHHYGTWAEG